MKVLVLSQSYPSKINEKYMAFVHSRNVEYISLGHDVDVLNFSCDEAYTYNEVQVLRENEIVDLKKYDMILSHAPNLRNHIRYIRKNLESINKIIFFLHGHEVLLKNKYYPKPYPFQRKSKYQDLLDLIYDLVKIKILKIIFTGFINQNKAHFVYVSKWMKDESQKCLKIKEEKLLNNSSVIFNAINPIFIEKSYSLEEKKVADVITIRPFDGVKYCIDEIVRIATINPNLKFHLFGKGEYFNHYSKPSNLVVINKFYEQEDIPELLNKYRMALMPTRLDAQGVMACEMAAFGIPLVTTDLKICKDMLNESKGVGFYSLGKEINLKAVYDKLSPCDPVLKEKFSPKILIKSELELITRVLKQVHTNSSNTLKNIFTMLAGNVGLQIISLLLFPIVARLYSPEVLGEYAYLISCIVLISSFATGQFQLAIPNPEEDKEAVSLALLAFKGLCIFSIVILLISLIYYFFNLNYVLFNKDMLLLVGPFLFVYGINEIFKSWAVRVRGMKKIVIALNLNRGTSLLLKIGFGLKFPLAMMLALSDLIGICFAIVYFSKSFIKNKVLPNNQKEVFEKYKKFSFFSIPSVFITVGSSEFPIILLGTFLASSEVGFYAIFQRLLIVPSIMLGNSISSSIARSIAEIRSEREKLLKYFLKVNFLLIAIFLPVSIIFFYFGEFFIVNLLGEKWRTSAIIMSASSIMILVKVLQIIVQTFFVSTEKVKQNLVFKVIEFLIVLVSFGGFYYTSLADSIRLFVFLSVSFTSIYLASFYFITHINRVSSE